MATTAKNKNGTTRGKGDASSSTSSRKAVAARSASNGSYVLKDARTAHVAKGNQHALKAWKATYESRDTNGSKH